MYLADLLGVPHKEHKIATIGRRMGYNMVAERLSRFLMRLGWRPEFCSASVPSTGKPTWKQTL
jgi:hypothetical protein